MEKEKVLKSATYVNPTLGQAIFQNTESVKDKFVYQIVLTVFQNLIREDLISRGD